MPPQATVSRAAQLASARIDDGAPLHEALFDAGVIDEGQRPLLRAAERTGDAPRALREVAKDMKQARALALGLLAGLAYPVFLLLCALFILPLPELVLHGFGPYLRSVLPPLLIGGGLFGGVAWALRTRRLTVALLLKPTRQVPGLAGYHRDAAAARVCRLLGRTLAAGLPVDDAMRSAGEALPYPDQRLALDGARRSVERGASLVEALGRSALLPPETLAAVGTAEAAGKLEDVLAKRAEVHEKAAVARSRVIAGVLAAVIGLVVMAGLALNIVSRFAEVLSGGGRGILPPDLR